MHMKAMTATPLVADQGLKCSPSPMMTQDEVLQYLKRQTPKKRNELVTALRCPARRQNFYLA